MLFPLSSSVTTSGRENRSKKCCNLIMKSKSLVLNLQVTLTEIKQRRQAKYFTDEKTIAPH